jgi:hypothetical protein
MERRRSRRHILCIPLVVDVGGDELVEGRLLDVSGGGMYVVVNAVLETKRLGRFSFGTVGDERRAHAFGRVVRYVFGDDETGVGITFTEHDSGFDSWVTTLDDDSETGRTRVAQLMREVVLRLR